MHYKHKIKFGNTIMTTYNARILNKQFYYNSLTLFYYNSLTHEEASQTSQLTSPFCVSFSSTLELEKL